MIINGIEYNIRFYVDDSETGEEIAEEIFEDFDQLNAFIKATEDLYEYADARAEYVPVEVIGGEPEEAGLFSYYKEPYMPLDEDDIEECLEDLKITIPEMEKDNFKEWEKTLAFFPADEVYEPGDASKAIPLSEYAYICPQCFNEVFACTCRSYPYNLIQIDRLLVPIIKELNIKGYRTMYSCAGHPDYYDGALDFVNVSFVEDYDFKIPFPESAKYSKTRKMLYFGLPKETDTESLKRYQKLYLGRLKDWAEAL